MKKIKEFGNYEFFLLNLVFTMIRAYNLQGVSHMRKVKIISENTKEEMEKKLEILLGDNEKEIVDMQFSVGDGKYSTLILYRNPSSEG
jgi:hypothetical protein